MLAYQPSTIATERVDLQLFREFYCRHKKYVHQTISRHPFQCFHTPYYPVSSDAECLLCPRNYGSPARPRWPVSSSALRSSSPDSSCASSNSGISMILKPVIECSPRFWVFRGAGRARCHRPGLEVSLWSFCESLAFLCSLGGPTRITHTSLTTQLSLCAEKKIASPPPARSLPAPCTGKSVTSYDSILQWRHTRYYKLTSHR